MTPYYVYRHVDPVTRQVKYVGIGQYDRAWSVRQTHRKQSHFMWLNQKISEGHTLQDIVEITHSNLTKGQASEIEKKLISEHKYDFNELHNPNHWQRGRKCDKEMAFFAKMLHSMGYGYIRIAHLMGSTNPNNDHMKIKRMISYV
jgi:hypothetical protein